MSSTMEPLTVQRMIRFEGEGSLKAFCDVAVGETLLIKGVRVVEGTAGLFVAMPRMQGKDDRWYDVVAPISTEGKAAMTQAVLAAYQSFFEAP